MTGSRAATAAGAAPAREADQALDLYRRMLLIRRFEDTVQALFLRGEVHGTTHLYSGQEAVAVGVCSVLAPQDRAAGTTGATDTRWRWGWSRRPCWTSCSAARPACAVGAPAR